MLNIQTDKKVCLCSVNMNYDTLLEIMKTDLIEDDYFIEFTFSDGAKGAIKKKHIIGFSEEGQESETY